MQGGTLQVSASLYAVSSTDSRSLSVRSCHSAHSCTGPAAHCSLSMDCVLQLLKRDAAFEGVRKKRSRFRNAGACCQMSVSEPAVANRSNGSRPAGKIASSVTELIGNTPMVYLNRVSFHHYADEADCPL